MTLAEAKDMASDIKERFDNPFSDADKHKIALLYRDVMQKEFKPTSCQQCYHDALIEICLTLKKITSMPKKCNYRMKAGFIISCPDFMNGKIFTNDNLTDKVAKAYLDKYPKMEDYFSIVPEEEKTENKLD